MFMSIKLIERKYEILHFFPMIYIILDKFILDKVESLKKFASISRIFYYANENTTLWKTQFLQK